MSNSKNEKELEKKREWFRYSDNVKTGFIKGATFGLRKVTYSVIDGLAIFEGDICLGTEKELIEIASEVTEEPLSARGVAYGIAITGEEYRWPNGVIPYEIDDSVTAQMETRIEDAIEHWTENTHIRFALRTTANSAQYPNFVRFIRDTGNWSYVGMRDMGMQGIGLATTCSIGNVIHEIGHAVGLWHEQSREDRDSFVTIQWANIISGTEHNFQQRITDGDDIGPYDYDSIMHYGAFAFTKNGNETIVTAGGQAIGQRTGLSAGDILAVRAIYPQLERPPQSTRLFRYWNGKAGDHFYTTSWSELGTGKSGWVYEGIACYIFPNPTTGTTPLFRYWNGKIADHFYTTNWSELGAGRSGWTLEGIQGYVFAHRISGTIPLYRYWNPECGDHFYTTNWKELGWGGSGWRYEGIQCYVYPLPPPSDEQVHTPESFEEPESMCFTSIDEEMKQPKTTDSEISVTEKEPIQMKKGRTVTIMIDLDKE